MSLNIQLLVTIVTCRLEKPKSWQSTDGPQRIFIRWTKKVDIALLNLKMRSWLGWKSIEMECRSLDEFEDITSRSTESPTNPAPGEPPRYGVKSKDRMSIMHSVDRVHCGNFCALRN